MWRLCVIFLLMTRIESLQCPKGCHCVQTANNATANATYQITCREPRNLTQLLHCLPSSVTQLIVHQPAFQTLHDLHQVLTETATTFPQLTDFSIVNSLVHSQPVKTSSVKEFQPFASLSNITPRGPGFTQLQILNLSNNTITYLPIGIFYFCSNLQTLDLSENLLKNFETDVFHSLINLQRLDLRRNQLKTLKEVIFRNLTKLLTLDVSFNRITSVAPTTFQFLISLNTLILAGNPLSASLVLLGAGHHLQVVDVSNTGLRQAPTTLERTVRTLQMKENLLKAIRCGDFDSYSLLSCLRLDSNHISYIEEDALGRLELLTELYLAHNILFHVPRSLPENLQILDLSFNLIQNITKPDFLNLSSLKYLSLSNNHIHNIENEAFSSLVNLKTLDLSRNPLLVLPPLIGPTHLQVLNLSYLTNVSRAWRLGIRTFPVPFPSNIVDLRLEASPALSTLFLSDTSTLKQFSNLSELHLRFSNLTVLRKDIFGLLPALKILRLEGNPWHCDREMLVTAEWLGAHGASESQEENAVNTMHCATPSQLHGKPLAALSSKDLQEDPQRIYEIEKLNTFEIFKNQSSFKRVQGNPSGARIYLKSYENSIESVDNSKVKIEKTSNALEGYRKDWRPAGVANNDRQLNDAPNNSTSSINDDSKNSKPLANHPITEAPTLFNLTTSVDKVTTKNVLPTKFSSQPQNNSERTKNNTLKESELRTQSHRTQSLSTKSEKSVITEIPLLSEETGNTTSNINDLTERLEELTSEVPLQFRDEVPWQDHVTADNLTEEFLISNKTGADALSAQPSALSTHPGLLIVFFIAIVVAAALVLTILQVARVRRNEGYVLQEQELETRSISSTANNDLW